MQTSGVASGTKKLLVMDGNLPLPEEEQWALVVGESSSLRFEPKIRKPQEHLPPCTDAAGVARLPEEGRKTA